MWAVVVVPVLVLTMPLFLQVVESRWLGPRPSLRSGSVAAPARAQVAAAGRPAFPARVSAA